jgi:hypothetical protein
MAVDYAQPDQKCICRAPLSSQSPRRGEAGGKNGGKFATGAPRYWKVASDNAVWFDSSGGYRARLGQVSDLITLSVI